MTNAKRVLIAEDDQFLRSTIASVLQEHGIDTITATNGNETIAVLDTQTVDLLLLDLLMPNTDGYAVLEHMRREGKDIPVVVLTNLNDAAAHKRCEEFGCRDFLIKSTMDEGDIWPAVEKYLKG